jgi:hypothetical protein
MERIKGSNHLCLWWWWWWWWWWVFCDLEKAFACINHDILLSKCEFYGFRGKTSTLLRSCLSDRCQRVLIDNSLSDNTTFLE